MKVTVVLFLVLIVGAVNGAPAEDRKPAEEKSQHALYYPWSRVVGRATPCCIDCIPTCTCCIG